MKIHCQGPRIRIRVAGELVNDYSPSKSLAGRIGLQIHGANRMITWSGFAGSKSRAPKHPILLLWVTALIQHPCR